jgi:hypothetical protein
MSSFADLRLVGLGDGAILDVAGAMASAVLGALLGWWLAQRSSAARLRAEARSAARHALARLYLLVWPPTRYAEFMAGLDELDADLLVARVSPTLRAALSLIATECWTDGAEMNDDQDSEPGISTRLLVGFRMVRNAVLLELASGRTRGGRQRAREVFDHLDRLIAADRADRGRRTAPLVAAEFATRTIDVDKESRSR